MRHSTLSPKYLQSTRGKSKSSRPRHLAARPSRFAPSKLSRLALEQTLYGIDRYREATDRYIGNLKGDPHAFQDDPYIEDMATDFGRSADALVSLILVSDPDIHDLAMTSAIEPIKGIWPARGILRDGHLYIAAADHPDRITLLADPSRCGEREGELDRMQLLVIPLTSIVDLDGSSDPGEEPELGQGVEEAGQGNPSPAGDVEAIFVAPVPSLA